MIHLYDSVHIYKQTMCKLLVNAEVHHGKNLHV